ncbi:MAG TPA: hypothetical protein VMB25_24135 [Bryobacteraceae bacterium]|nr:hypothetical protein [Bryobacteraceae bacterium]
MASPDPIQSAFAGIAKELISVTLKQAEDFLAAATGQEGKSAGTMLGNLLRRKKHNAINVIAAAERARREAGVTVTKIPLRILQPVLDGASIEDDPDIQARWACLLTNAADPREVTPVSPMFPFILRDLGPREVKFLDALHAICVQKVIGDTVFKRVSQILFRQGDLKDLFVKLGFTRVPKLSSATFEEQHLPDFDRDQNAFYLLLDLIRNHDLVREHIPPDFAQALVPGHERVYHFTELGDAFVRACQPPNVSERPGASEHFDNPRGRTPE